MNIQVGIKLLVSLAVLATACAPASDRGQPDAGGAGSPSQDDQRTLVIAMRWEPKTLTRLTPAAQGISPKAPAQIFHAGLVQWNEKNVPQLQLAEAFPQLGTDSWKVFPDGRMETSWRLRPNLLWHDGAPLVADDFVMAWEFGEAANLPGSSADVVEEVFAPDPRTVVVRYRKPTREAGQTELEPLPRHILGQSVEQLKDAGNARDVLYALPYWATSFVGLGPYQLTSWEPGTFISGVAFPGYVGGKPRIGKIQLVWIADANTAVANLLSGTVHLATDVSVAFEQAAILRQEWSTRGEPGAFLLGASKVVLVQLQFRPEFVRPQSLLDLRFRQALASGIDKQAIVEAVLDSEPGMADTLVTKDEEYYADLDRVLTKYPLDVRRSDQLLSDLGYRKDADGLYGQAGSRLNVGMIVAGGAGGYPREALILADSWKRAGLDVQTRTLSAAEQLDMAIGSTYPALRITQFQVGPVVDPFTRLNTASMATEARRWSGPNKGGFAHPEFDRLSDAYASSLDRSEQHRLLVQGMSLVSEEVPILPLYYGYDVVAHTGKLVGPRGPRQSNAMWKAEEWHWQ